MRKLTLAYDSPDHRQWDSFHHVGDLVLNILVEWLPADYKGYFWSVQGSDDPSTEDLTIEAGSGYEPTLAKAKQAALAAAQRAVDSYKKLH